MTAERWACIEELFHRAIECAPGESAQLLDEAGKADPDLRREVEALLSSYGSAGDHLEAAVREEREQAFTTSTLDSSEADSGAIIGPYRLIERIGEGGMGEVWLAEQKQPVRRRVALKLIKPGMDTREVVKRFESERQALALMDHPNIAKVFDAGSTSQGHPYFVMEYVAGVPITEYCDKHKLTTRERLELFIHICEGVQHAHQKAILHRDLKPSNILVSEVDGQPRPRIIDFGVAKAISQPLTAETMYTRAGAIVGTPGYMSPEQADSGGQDIDTRTDVYSLGVVLYELLVSALPLDFQKLPFDEILRKLREEDAPKPSTKVRSLGPMSTTTAQNRRTDPPTLARQLRGDLDAITLKALEKDRSRRYATPSELGADIGRHLRHEPVVARPASTAYRTRKYIRRHRIGVAVAAAAVLLLASFAVAQAFEIRRVTQERDRVTRERDRADRITKFMTSMFKVSDPSESRGNKVTAREILDKASKDIDTGLEKDPELQAQMMDVMGGVYVNLGIYSEAEQLLTKAVNVRRRVLGSDNPATLACINELATTLMFRARYAQAEKLSREALAADRRLFGADNPATLISMAILANVLNVSLHHAEAEKLYRELLEADRRVLGPEHEDTLKTMNNLAFCLYVQRRYAEAESLHRKVLEIRRRSLGADHPETLSSMHNLAATLNDEGRYQESANLQREALNSSMRILGPEHPATLASMDDLGSALGHLRRFAEAEKLQKEETETYRRILGPDHPETATATYNLACTFALEGNRDQALILLRQSIDHGLRRTVARAIDKDSDFTSLHSDPRFAALVTYARERAAIAGKP